MNIAARLYRSLMGGARKRENPTDGQSRFSPGACDELIALREAHPDRLFSDKFQFGLKQFGSLYIIDWILKHKPQRVLEMGAGLNNYFDRATGAMCDYWMVDDSGFYDADAFANALEQRNNTTFISGLVGQSLPDLPKGHFDLIFSVSVLEHAPAETIPSIAAHMRQLLRPGGRIIHSLDLPVRFAPSRARPWYKSLSTAGFDIPDPQPFTQADALIKGAALLEPVHIVHEYYGKDSGSDKTHLREWHNTSYIINSGAT